MVGDVRHALEFDIEDITEQILCLRQLLCRSVVVIGDLWKAELLQVGGLLDHWIELPGPAWSGAGNTLDLHAPPRVVDHFEDDPLPLDHRVILEMLVVVDAATQVPFNAAGLLTLAP
jgi:hypothetical protein